jgi:hypothetical protein
MAEIRIKDLPLNTPVLSSDIFIFEKNVGDGSYTTSQNVLSVLGNFGGGIQGIQGVQGIPGQGLQGMAGTAQGVQGNQGVQGGVGNQGVQGISNQGIQGVQGIFGNQGIQGVKGETGTSISIVGQFALTPGSEQLELNDIDNSWYPPQPGYGVIDSNTGNIWIYDGAMWDNAGQIKGPAGSQGSQGIQGVQGLSNQGVQGTQGIFGFQGDQGVQGIIGLQGVQGIIGLQGVQGIIGTTFDYTEVSTNITLESNNGYIFDTTAASLTATLPVSPNTGDYINITLTRGGSNDLTIARNGKNIDGEALDVVCDVSGTFSLIYVGSNNNWKFVPFSGLTTPVVKVFKATWEPPYSEIAPTDNITTGSRIKYNTVKINTDSTVFELISGGSFTNTSINIKIPGIYQITSALHIFDVLDGSDYYVQLLKQEGTPQATEELIRAITDIRGGETSTDQMLYGTTLIQTTAANTYVYTKLIHNVGGGALPFPSERSDIAGVGGSPTEITITKIA